MTKKTKKKLAVASVCAVTIFAAWKIQRPAQKIIPENAKKSIMVVSPNEGIHWTIVRGQFGAHNVPNTTQPAASAMTPEER